MKYLRVNVLSCGENQTEKKVYKADIVLPRIQKLQNGQTLEVQEVLTISSKVKLSTGDQFLRIFSEFNIQNKIYITVDESSQKLEIQKK